MNPPLIITIGREFGSGGHEIGAKVAEKLGIAFYDKKIISLAAEKSGLSDEFIEKNEQRSKSSFIQNLAASSVYSGGFFSSQYMPLSESIFISQAQVIRDIAAKESAVIVGRCSDYILAGRQNTINVFIHAPVEVRVARIMRIQNMTEADAMKLVATSDKERGNHYFRYTDRKWGKAQNYDLSINSSLLGIDRTVELLIKLAGIEERGNIDN
ncbi:MAG: cytidylate kinase-like family protein [Clostridia bacterium]|nr:cytidylate kinase-like family protein [Clostridia bacterium]